MSLDELEADIKTMISSFRLTANKATLLREASFQFIIEEFGVIICGINRADYTMVRESINTRFGDGWRVVYVSVQDPLLEKKDDILWELMRGGYIQHIRSKYPRQFRELVVMQNFGKKIIDKRLAVWGDTPKYRYLVDENKAALKEASTYILSINPGFYDYMP